MWELFENKKTKSDHTKRKGGYGVYIGKKKMKKEFATSLRGSKDME